MPALKDHVLYPSLKNLPHRPGVYVYKDAESKVLYVGKAKDLAKRVKSYFHNFAGMTAAKQLMIERARQLDYVIVGDETEALILENKYIKSYRPPYNVVWKDDKDFSYLFIDWNEPYPRLQIARRLEEGNKKKNVDYFGPYPTGSAVKQTVKALHRAFPFRTCDRDLSKIPNGTVCLLYHLKQCLGPCAAKCSPEEYRAMMERLRDFLRGNIAPLSESLAGEMSAAAAGHNFELAARLRDQRKALEFFASRQQLADKRGISADVLNVSVRERSAVISRLCVRHGHVAKRDQWRVELADNDAVEALAAFVAQFYAAVPAQERPKEVIVPLALEEAAALKKAYGIAVRTAERGEKRNLLALGQENADSFWKRAEKSSVDHKQALAMLRDELANAGLPLAADNALARIECYDISNFQGDFPVGSQVVFANGTPAKKEYRHYVIRDVQGPNDFAMHAEMMRRRLQRSYGEQPKGTKPWPKPDLIVIDGGVGQINAVLPLIRAADPAIPVVGLAKQFEEIYLALGDQASLDQVLRLGLDHPGLQMLQRLRDESHRFGITHYRGRHAKAMLQSPFDDVAGIGPKRKKALKEKYGSLAAARSAPLAELAALVGEKAAREILK